MLEASLCALEELLCSSKHGLCSDFTAYDPLAKRYHAVKTQVLERPGDGTFSWNACRCVPAPSAGRCAAAGLKGVAGRGRVCP